jgi:hypothetical protein
VFTKLWKTGSSERAWGFGHSAGRISDYYADLVGEFSNSQAWKRLRITPNDHDQVNEAMGSVEAFARLLKGER